MPSPPRLARRLRKRLTRSQTCRRSRLTSRRKGGSVCRARAATRPSRTAASQSLVLPLIHVRFFIEGRPDNVLRRGRIPTRTHSPKKSKSSAPAWGIYLLVV